MVAPRVRACSDTKESDDKERRKGKKSGRRRSRTRGVLAFESRHFVSLQSYLLTVSRRLVVVQKLDARESSRLSLSLFSPKKKKKHSSHGDSRLSSDTPPKDDDFDDGFDDLLALEKSLLLLLLSRGKVYRVVYAFSLGGWVPFQREWV